MSLASHSVPPLVCYGALFALLLRRLVRVSSRRPGSAAAWLSHAPTWHLPLVLLGVAVVVVRIAFLLFLHQDAWKTERLEWLLLELPSALVAIFLSYLLLIHAHVVFIRTWPVQWSSILISLRCLFAGFSVLIISTTTLFVIGRCTTDSPLTTLEWNKLHWLFSSVVWIILGATLLRYQTMSAHVLCQERDARRPTIVPPFAVHSLLMAETFLSLITLLRGAVLGIFAVVISKDHQQVSPSFPTGMTSTAFVYLYGSWEVLTVLVIYRLSCVVPVVSKSRYTREGICLTGLSTRGEAQPVLLFSPKEAVAEYLQVTSIIKQSQSRRGSHRLNETSSYMFEDRELGDDEDTALAAADEPLLCGVSDSDDEDGDSSTDFTCS